MVNLIVLLTGSSYKPIQTTTVSKQKHHREKQLPTLAAIPNESGTSSLPSGVWPLNEPLLTINPTTYNITTPLTSAPHPFPNRKHRTLYWKLFAVLPSWFDLQDPGRPPLCSFFPASSQTTPTISYT